MLDPTKIPALAKGAIGGIANSARALLIPSASLYFECNQERIRQHQLQVAALDLQLEYVRKRAFAAAVKLMALAGPKPSQADQPDRNAEEALS